MGAKFQYTKKASFSTLFWPKPQKCHFLKAFPEIPQMKWYLWVSNSTIYKGLQLDYKGLQLKWTDLQGITVRLQGITVRLQGFTVELQGITVRV